MYLPSPHQKMRGAVINNKTNLLPKFLLTSPYSCVLHKRGGTVKADLKIRKKKKPPKPTLPPKVDDRNSTSRVFYPRLHC